ncbi:Imm32 family immunity protein [Deinococcus humi]|uniref:Uncharacterized protein n=1 Tax=Deinococcus humi TaxID=662880 RepID=A0A7W8NER9_9DEIO|nr:hypothetical protein [Deinococcus humi]MBB5364649.1 hypothetical protein [Deinococcus humi]
MPMLSLDVPDYSPEGGFGPEWDEGFQIALRIEDGQVYLQANNAGLRSLARLLLGLTVDGVQDWHHWHLEDWNSLEEGSVPLTVMKFPEQP